jgi:cell division protein FtsB
MNAEVQVDTNEIISALSQQIAGLSRDVAVLNAVVEAQKKEIARLRQVENVAKPEISE